MFLRKFQVLIALLAITNSNVFSASRAQEPASIISQLARSKYGTFSVVGALTTGSAYTLYRVLKVEGRTPAETTIITAQRWALFAASTAAAAAAVTLMKNNEAHACWIPKVMNLATLGASHFANKVTDTLTIQREQSHRTASSESTLAPLDRRYGIMF